MRRRLFWAMVTVAFVTLVIAGVSGAVLVERSLSQEREEEFFRQAAATGRLIENLVDAGDRPVGAARQVARLRELMETAQLVGGHDYVEALVETPRRSFAIPPDAELVTAVPAAVTDRAVVTDAFGTKLFPETWIIDKNGLVRLRFDGAFDWASPVALDLIRAYR